jgi:histidyl-tRNA synthetase
MHGFEYYTGICFQFMAGGEKIGGGGRYDKLVPLMEGGNIPACGFALYVDPMMPLLPLEKKNGKSGISIRGKGFTPEIAKKCFAAAESLRDAGYATEIDFVDREEDSCRWVILVSGKKPSRFVLKDRIYKRRREVASISEILKVVSEG